MLIGYARVSTAEQSLDLQRDALLGAGVPPGRVYEDVCSGKSAERQLMTAEMVEANVASQRRIFENVFANALAHGGTGVTVRVERLDDGFAVEDDGPGIPA